MDKSRQPPASKGGFRLTLFADERKRITNSCGNTWSYIGLMAVPTDRLADVHGNIMSLRAKVGFEYPIKFRDVKMPKGEKYELVMALVAKFVEAGQRASNEYFFYLFGVNQSRVRYESFGGSIDDRNTFSAMYQRFFRTAVIGGLKYFCDKSYRPIVVDAVYHDSEGNLEEHPLFRWHTLRQAAMDEAFEVRCKEVEFVSSDHRDEPCEVLARVCASHILQYVDVILGAMSHCLDYGNPNPGKDGVARRVAPLLSRMVNCPLNKNSSYGHYKRYCVGFFPDTKGLIYHRRTLLIEQPQLPFGDG